MIQGPQLERVMLKLSGEALCGEVGGYGIQPETLREFCLEIAEVHALGTEIGIVIGGGNIFRGLKGSASGMDRSSADYMGMLATVINGIALQDGLEKAGQADPKTASLADVMDGQKISVEAWRRWIDAGERTSRPKRSVSSGS